MIPTDGEIAVIGAGKSGVAATTLLRRQGYNVYLSDVTAKSLEQETVDELIHMGANVELGVHALGRIAAASCVVVSPGVPPDAPPLQVAREHGLEIISEVELALRIGPVIPYIAVTGTNGKTTTTALVGHLLRTLGYHAIDAGNIGTPFTEVMLRDPLPDWVSLELSSFQLHDTPSLAPAVGVLTNLSPDHLDRYSTVNEYYADKARLFHNATSSSRWVINADDSESCALTREIAGKQFYFSVQKENKGHSDARYDRVADTLVVLGEPLLSRPEFPLLGDHNVANALAAALAVMVASEHHQTPTARLLISKALHTFRALPHRLELVGEWHGIQWINDSKATNISSTYVAIQGMTRPTVLLLGGRHKGEPYTGLAEPIGAHVKHVIAYGEAAERVEHDLHGLVPIDCMGTDFKAVLTRARDLAVSGDAILLSPACSSYDMFKNYEERGAQFRSLAQQQG